MRFKTHLSQQMIVWPIGRFILSIQIGGSTRPHDCGMHLNRNSCGNSGGVGCDICYKCHSEDRMGGVRKMLIDSGNWRDLILISSNNHLDVFFNHEVPVPKCQYDNSPMKGAPWLTESTSAPPSTWERQPLTQARQKGWSQESRPNLRSEGASFPITFSRQILHSCRKEQSTHTSCTLLAKARSSFHETASSIESIGDMDHNGRA